MKAALVTSLDGPGAIVIEDIAAPSPGPGEVLVRVTTVALNFADTLITRGKYQVKPALPFSPGAEIAGVVEALGEGVEGPRVGTRVAAYVGHGGARELLAVKAEAVVPIPDQVSDEIAAGIAVTYGTAVHGLKDRGYLAKGETVAILGASGGAGQAAIEVAKLMGARVIACASSPDKLEVCRDFGADDLLSYGEGDLKEALRTATGGRGPDIIYDCIGGPYAEPAFRAIAWEGRYLIIGFAAGEIPKLPLNLPLLKGASAIGVSWGNWVARNPAGHRDNMHWILDWIAEGRLKPRLHGVYPLSEIRDAIAILDRREATGKIVLKV